MAERRALPLPRKQVDTPRLTGGAKQPDLTGRSLPTSPGAKVRSGTARHRWRVPVHLPLPPAEAATGAPTLGQKLRNQWRGRDPGDLQDLVHQPGGLILLPQKLLPSLLHAALLQDNIKNLYPNPGEVLHRHGRKGGEKGSGRWTRKENGTVFLG